ncbi:RsmD family RNA methyltransferase [Candidatus Vidania fulgoroideorum]
MRIIKGKIKGKKINLNKKLKKIVRPTKSIIRKSIFEVIGEDIKKFKCLDLFCGTGSLGLEAYSRGAIEVKLVDIRRNIVKVIKKFTRKNNIKNVNCEARDYIEFIKNSMEKYNIIFLDPPYNLFYKQSNLVSRCNKILEDKGVIYLENYKSKVKKNIKFRGFKNIRVGSKGKIIYFLLLKKKV